MEEGEALNNHDQRRQAVKLAFGSLLFLAITVWVFAYQFERTDTADILYLDMREVLRVPVDLMSLEETRALVTERFQAYNETFVPPGVYDDEAEKWRCDWCPVAQHCAELRAKGVA